MLTKDRATLLASNQLPGTVLPPFDWVPITPSDGSDLPQVYRAIRANVAGDVACILAGTPDATTRTLKFAAGETRNGYFVRVLATGTTATGLEGAV